MPRKSRARTFKNWLIYRGLIAAAAGGRSLSLENARGVGSLLGNLARGVVPRERRRAMRNLALAFPGMSRQEREEIVEQMFRHLGQSLLEIAWLPNLDASLVDETTVIEGRENFQAAVDAGKGVVLFTGHCGNWEWMAAVIGLLGYDMNVVARELYDPRINDFVVASRARHSITTIGRGSLAAAREILQTLKRGEILGVLIDQSIKAENVTLPFLGHPAPTPVGPARLAIRAGAAAIAGFIERSGERQIIRFREPVFTSRSDDAVELTRRMNQEIEEQIRRVPAQWVWMHERWRVRQ
jgi:Kdo2-lipid IVA lauroyltransferase/acyltransferase